VGPREDFPTKDVGLNFSSFVSRLNSKKKTQPVLKLIRVWCPREDFPIKGIGINFSSSVMRLHKTKKPQPVLKLIRVWVPKRGLPDKRRRDKLLVLCNEVA
jgi:hypothetical protein